ncbi:hypothetical protein HUS23_08835 [Ectothiorhodospiraceae bacterium 2226]|nr:hypothetical protein HUS23_08835 [Ectothiorhodospiraceae bacterium 2226]
MAKLYCKYHRDVPGRHRCGRCGIVYCRQCVTGDAAEPRCPVCTDALASLGIGNTIQPFWQRLPRIFAYPATPGVLGYLAVLSLISIFMGLPLVGLVVALAVTYAILKYGYVILESTAQGNLTPEHVTLKHLDSGNHLPLKQIGVFAVMIMAVVAIAHFVPPLALPAWLFFLLAIPASVIVLATTESFVEAINPLRLAAVMHQIGWSYLVLYAFLILLSVSSGVAQEILANAIPVWLFLMVGTFVGGYFMLIMFHLMGYVVYQYHEQLGYEGVREFEAEPAGAGAAPSTPAASPAAAPSPSAALLQAVDILLAEGKTAEAKQRLAAEVRRSNEPALHARYHKLLLTLGDKDALAKHARRYVALLMQRKERAKAVDVYAAVARRVPGFAVEDPQATFALGTAAAELGRPDVALRALSGYAGRFPDSEHIPAAYFLAAKLLCEHKNDCRQARQILRSLAGRFPGHAMAEQFRQYLAFVERLEGAPSP